MGCLLAACTALPPRGPAPISHAFDGTQNTPLARIAVTSQGAGADAEVSGFRLLPTGEFAFDARTALARRAQRSLDLQYYHVQRDRAGLSLLRELRDAAARGVRVRLLVDDFYVSEIDDLLVDLAAHSDVQIRLFNPLSLRSGNPVLRLLLSSGSFELNNHRMHNKLFIADNAIAIYGGRNVADEYFMGDAEFNFIDMDVLSTGAVVRSLSAVFDTYWNSQAAWPLQALSGSSSALTSAHDAQLAKARFDAAVRDATPPTADYPIDPIGQTSVQQQIAGGRLKLVMARARVFADPPDKAIAEVVLNQPTAAMQGMLDVIAGAKKEVIIASPYFVPGPIGMRMMREATARGTRVVLYTNSLGTTDEPLVHDKYSSYRAEMLDFGVEIFEFNPGATQRSTRFGDFGRSVPRLHAKVATVDRRYMLVGSVNLDARSAIGNTEMSVVVDSPPLAQLVHRLISSDRFVTMYRLRLAPNGESIEWLSRDAEGHETVTTEEPEGDWWLRVKLWMLSLMIDERLL